MHHKLSPSVRDALHHGGFIAASESAEPAAVVTNVQAYIVLHSTPLSMPCQKFTCDNTDEGASRAPQAASLVVACDDACGCDVCAVNMMFHCWCYPRVEFNMDLEVTSTLLMYVEVTAACTLSRRSRAPPCFFFAPICFRCVVPSPRCADALARCATCSSRTPQRLRLPHAV
jgi:hypothetical protein